MYSVFLARSKLELCHLYGLTLACFVGAGFYCDLIQTMRLHSYEIRVSPLHS